MTRQIKPDTNSKIYQKDFTELDTSNLKIAEFGRRNQTMWHIINYDVNSLKHLEKTGNNKSVCGKEYWVSYRSPNSSIHLAKVFSCGV